MAEEREAYSAWCRERLRQLRADFAFIEGEYKAGRISLADEVAQLAQIITETTAIIDEYTALEPDRSNPAPPISN